MQIIDFGKIEGIGMASATKDFIPANRALRDHHQDPENSQNYEILFVEKVDETKSLLVHSKDKTSIDLEGKDLIIFLLQQPESYMRQMDDIQTQVLPQFEYIFNPSKPKSMG